MFLQKLLFLSVLLIEINLRKREHNLPILCRMLDTSFLYIMSFNFINIVVRYYLF